MDPEVVASILGASAVTAVVGAIVNGFINRRKLGAEATSIITQAAGGLVASLQNDNAVLRAEDAKRKLQAERNARATRKRDAFFRSQFSAHLEYDRKIVKALRDAGIAVEMPPEISFPSLEDFYDDDDYLTAPDVTHPES